MVINLWWRLSNFFFFSFSDFFSRSFIHCLRIKAWTWVPHWENYSGIWRCPLRKGFILKKLFKKFKVRFLCAPSLTYIGQWCNTLINPLQLVNITGSGKSNLGNFILSIIKGFVLSFNNCVSNKEFKISNSARTNGSEYM